MKEFLSFNKSCPICEEPLTLYMQWSGDSIDTNKRLFISRLEKNNLKFEEHKLSRDNVSFKRKGNKNIEISMILKKIEDDNYVMNFNSLTSEKSAKNQQGMFFFFLCNPKGIEDLGYDYEINIYNGCYYRSSPFVKITSLTNHNLIKTVSESNNINRDEYFVIKNKVGDLEKVYTLALNNEDNKTFLYHYAITDEQSSQEDFEANIFEKEMPPLKNRPSFDQDSRIKLINRLDGWVLMS